MIVLKLVSLVVQFQIFSRFAAKYLPVRGKSCTSFESIKKCHPQVDVYCTGSDQVWNSDYNIGIDLAMFLDFAPVGKIRIAFAASFGKEHLRLNEENETRELLSKYAAISVRESTGVAIVEKLGVSGAQHVLDPTLLLTKEQWKNECRFTKPKETRYLAIYSVERSIDELVYTTAQAIGKSLGLSLIYITTAGRTSGLKLCDTQRTFLSVEEILGYLFYADFIVASSFHGTAFAINFNRPFVSVLPPTFGGRSRSLLNLTGLTDRIVGHSVDLSRVLPPIDYTNVNEVLDRERDASLAFLTSALNKVT